MHNNKSHHELSCDVLGRMIDALRAGCADFSVLLLLACKENVLSEPHVLHESVSMEFVKTSLPE